MALFNLLAFFLFFLFQGCSAMTFTFTNNCAYTVWPAAAPITAAGEILTTGFVLEVGESRRLDAPAGWSGSLWGRTLCGVDSGGHFACETGDCGGSAGAVECSSAGGSPSPTTPLEFTPSDAGGGAVTFCHAAASGSEKYNTAERLILWIYTGRDRGGPHGFASPSMARGGSLMAGVSLLAVGVATMLV